MNGVADLVHAVRFVRRDRHGLRAAEVAGNQCTQQGDEEIFGSHDSAVNGLAKLRDALLHVNDDDVLHSVARFCFANNFRPIVPVAV
jgi:hypothetical protein